MIAKRRLHLKKKKVWFEFTFDLLVGQSLLLQMLSSLMWLPSSSNAPFPCNVKQLINSEDSPRWGFLRFLFSFYAFFSSFLPCMISCKKEYSSLRCVSPKYAVFPSHQFSDWLFSVPFLFWSSSPHLIGPIDWRFTNFYITHFEDIYIVKILKSSSHLFPYCSVFCFMVPSSSCRYTSDLKLCWSVENRFIIRKQSNAINENSGLLTRY